MHKAPIAKVWYALAENKKQYKKLIKQLGIKDTLPISGDACTHIYYNHATNSVSCIVYVNNKPEDKLEYYALLVHEAVHIYQQVVEWMNDSEPSDEFAAYCIQLITLDLLKDCSV